MREKRNITAQLIGANIRRIRLEHGETQQQLGALLGYGPTTVANYESGYRLTDLEHSFRSHCITELRWRILSGSPKFQIRDDFGTLNSGEIFAARSRFTRQTVIPDQIRVLPPAIATSEVNFFSYSSDDNFHLITCSAL